MELNIKPYPQNNLYDCATACFRTALEHTIDKHRLSFKVTSMSTIRDNSGYVKNHGTVIENAVDPLNRWLMPHGIKFNFPSSVPEKFEILQNLLSSKTVPIVSVPYEELCKLLKPRSQPAPTSHCVCVYDFDYADKQVKIMDPAFNLIVPTEQKFVIDECRLKIPLNSFSKLWFAQGPEVYWFDRCEPASVIRKRDVNKQKESLFYYGEVGR